MANTHTLTLTADEAEILADALEADMEGYIESAKEARESGSGANVLTFTEAAQRVQKLLLRVQELIEDD